MHHGAICMSATVAEKNSEHAKRGAFKTTHWSVVLAVGGGSGAAAQRALEELCRIYWFPLYAFVRRQGKSPEDAEDLTQEFFARFLASGYFLLADRERGRFRTFLLTSLKRFQTEEWRRDNRQKRGGDVIFISMRGNSSIRSPLSTVDFPRQVNVLKPANARTGEMSVTWLVKNSKRITTPPLIVGVNCPSNRGFNSINFLLTAGTCCSAGIA